MKRYLLAPLGLAEPDDVPGWMEHGGLLALQRALALGPVRLRHTINDTHRRDGTGPLAFEAGQPAALDLSTGTVPGPRRFVIEEMPAWLLEGAILMALACEQPGATLYVTQRRGEPRVLLEEVLANLSRVGVTGPNGWAGGVEIEIRTGPPPPGTLDPVTALLLPVLVWERRDPGTTLLEAVGAVRSPGVYEIPFGLPVREFLYRWAGGLTENAQLLLGDHRLTPEEMAAPLTIERFGRALGSGQLSALV